MKFSGLYSLNRNKPPGSRALNLTSPLGCQKLISSAWRSLHKRNHSLSVMPTQNFTATLFIAAPYAAVPGGNQHNPCGKYSSPALGFPIEGAGWPVFWPFPARRQGIPPGTKRFRAGLCGQTRSGIRRRHPAAHRPCTPRRRRLAVPTAGGKASSALRATLPATAQSRTPRSKKSPDAVRIRAFFSRPVPGLS